MAKQVLLTTAVGLIIGAIFGAGVTLYSQTRASSLSDLTQEKQAVTKMQWVLLNAKVNALGAAPQSAALMESARFVTSLNFMYDENSKRIVAVAFVNPSWLLQAPVQETRKLFMMRGIDFCNVALYEAFIDAGLPAGAKVQNNCSVRFITWNTEDKNLSSKDVAVFDNWQVVLK
jgi:hypothetical protein